MLTPWKRTVEHLNTPAGPAGPALLAQRLNLFEPPAVAYLTDLLRRERLGTAAAAAAVYRDIVRPLAAAVAGGDEEAEGTAVPGEPFRATLLRWLHVAVRRFARGPLRIGAADGDGRELARHTGESLYAKALARLRAAHPVRGRVAELLHRMEEADEPGLMDRLHEAVTREFPDRVPTRGGFRKEVQRARERFAEELLAVAACAAGPDEVVDLLESAGLLTHVQKSAAARDRFRLPPAGRVS